MGKSLETRVEELEKMVKKLAEEKQIRFRKGLNVGDTFSLAGLTWKILEISDKGYHCQTVDRYGSDRQFDVTSSNWNTSKLRAELHRELLKNIEAEIGKGNVIPFERNLLSLDGQTEYGRCEDMVSLLTVDEYRKYRSMLSNTDDYWWWLITPWSTPCNDYKTSVVVVSPLGYIFGSDGSYSNGVRPFCIFSSAIFESENN